MKDVFIILLIITIAGLIISMVIKSKSNMVGDLLVIYDEEEPKPYLFLEIADWEALQNDPYVYFRVIRKKNNYFNGTIKKSKKGETYE